MKVELRCLSCNGKELQETKWENNFYCPNCDIEVHLTECDIEVLEVVEVTLRRKKFKKTGMSIL
ncbi:MAG: hypothetical protein ACRCWG_02925 [Sarcina sp.]